MKKIILLLAITLIAVSCNSLSEGEYSITGTIKGLPNGIVYLEKPDENGMSAKAVDTVKIIDGKFEIKGNSTEPEMYFLQVEKVNGKVAFILEEGEISVEVDKDSIFKSKIGGTYSNDEFYSFNQKSNEIQKSSQKKIMDFQMKNMAKMKEAQEKNDTVAINSLRKEYKGLQKNMTDFLFGYPKDHPKSYISMLIIQSMIGNPEHKIEDVEIKFNALDKKLKETKVGKKIAEKIKEIKNASKAIPTTSGINVGAVAPDFSAKNPQGKIVSLKSSLGKVTIIDFWASWCGPCRAENPNVVALYNELHTKGLNIIGVSLDKDAAKWKEAIAKDGLTWTQISNLKEFNDPIAKQYGITQIPTTYILDSKGTIVAKDLRGKELKSKVLELLNSK
ncbi:TlpA disulfide reductase family protein [Flavobacterium dankookense]|nr:TlpA disulfide reductase family protein [Flavobacterium dankookense]